MSEEDVRCAINPFFTRKEIGAGIGLGLTVAYNLMLNHGGELSINSENGKGTVVILKFPFTDVLFD
jgi:two-component system NtrC family sensor kinase